jgi:hypothetical protein
MPITQAEWPALINYVERGAYRSLTRILQELQATNLLGGLKATLDELNDVSLSANTQALTAAGAVSLSSRLTTLVGPSSGTYAVTLAAPDKAGRLKIIQMLSTTGSNAVTMALTNVVGGSAANTASFDAANETLVLLSNTTRWVVLKEVGVTLS